MAGLKEKEIGYPDSEAPDEKRLETPLGKINLTQIATALENVGAVVPTGTPVKIDLWHTVKIYSSGGTVRLYIWDEVQGSWWNIALGNV